MMIKATEYVSCCGSGVEPSTFTVKTPEQFYKIPFVEQNMRLKGFVGHYINNIKKDRAWVLLCILADDWFPTSLAFVLEGDWRVLGLPRFPRGDFEGEDGLRRVVQRLANRKAKQ